MARIHSALAKALKMHHSGPPPSFWFPADQKKWKEDQLQRIHVIVEKHSADFHFPDWYLIHLVFPDDIAVYRKMLSKAEKPHERLYVLIVGIVYVDQHYGHQGWNRKDLSDFQDEILFPWIESFRETMESMMDAKEYDHVSRLVRNSPLNRGIEHCAYAWVLGSAKKNELHRYPVR